MAMTHAAVGHGFGDEGGTIVNVTVSPHHGMPAMAHTGAARAAVEALTRELAGRWATRGIAVVAAAIGRFDTASLRKYPEVVWRGAARSVPLQRLGDVREFGWLVTLLATPLGPRAERLGRHPRRRRRQLVRPLAAAVAGRGRRDGADRGSAVLRPPRRRPPPRGVGTLARLAGEVLWLHRSLPSF